MPSGGRLCEFNDRSKERDSAALEKTESQIVVICRGVPTGLRQLLALPPGRFHGGSPVPVVSPPANFFRASGSDDTARHQV